MTQTASQQVTFHSIYIDHKIAHKDSEAIAKYFGFPDKGLTAENAQTIVQFYEQHVRKGKFKNASEAIAAMGTAQSDHESQVPQDFGMEIDSSDLADSFNLAGFTEAIQGQEAVSEQEEMINHLMVGFLGEKIMTAQSYQRFQALSNGAQPSNPMEAAIAKYSRQLDALMPPSLGQMGRKMRPIHQISSQQEPGGQRKIQIRLQLPSVSTSLQNSTQRLAAAQSQKQLQGGN